MPSPDFSDASADNDGAGGGGGKSAEEDIRTAGQGGDDRSAGGAASGGGGDGGSDEQEEEEEDSMSVGEAEALLDGDLQRRISPRAAADHHPSRATASKARGRSAR